MTANPDHIVTLAWIIREVHETRQMEAAALAKAILSHPTHAGLWLEIPRQRARTGPSCLDCSRWRGGSSPCRDGMPDASVRNLGFAADCELYDPRAGWEERQRLRAQLTEQAAVARQTGPH